MKTVCRNLNFIDELLEKSTTAAREPPASRGLSDIEAHEPLEKPSEKTSKNWDSNNLRLINTNTYTKPCTFPEELADKLNYTYNHSSTYSFSSTMALSRGIQCLHSRAPSSYGRS